MSAADPDRVTATPAALELVAELTAEYGPVISISRAAAATAPRRCATPPGISCWGTAISRLGTIGGAGVYISRSQGAAWAHTRLIIDVVPGRGGKFSLDNGRERRFLTRSRGFNPAEA